MTQKQHKALAAYVFAGGFSLGVESEGFDVLAHLEDNGYGVDTCRLNFPDMPIYVGPENWDIESLHEEGPKWIFGNPPCAAWSALNGKKTTEGTWKIDDRVDCTRRHFALMNTYRPLIWTWESVLRAWTVGRDFVNELVNEAVAMGYSVDLVLMNAEHVGGKHKRERFFFMATKSDIDWLREEPVEAPTAREVLKDADPSGFSRQILDSMADAWEKTKPGEAVRRGWKRAFPDEKDHEVITSSTGSTRVKGRPGFNVRRLDPDKVAPTIVGASAMHWDEPRHLSLREATKLCGYPDNFKFAKETIGTYDELTRAVMPPVAAWVARQVHEALDRDDELEQPRVRLVELRDPENRRVVDLIPEQREDAEGETVTFWAEPPKPRKVRASKPRKPPAPKTVAIEDVSLPADIPGPLDIHRDLTTSGGYIKALLQGNQEGSWRLSDEQIAAQVRKKFDGRKTTVNDVAYQRSRIAKEEAVSIERIYYHEADKGESDDRRA